MSSDKSKIFLPVDIIRLDTSRGSDTRSGDKDGYSDSENVENPYNFIVGSAVQYLEFRYGVIKWIGDLPGVKSLYAGIEVVRQLNLKLLILMNISKK